MATFLPPFAASNVLLAAFGFPNDRRAIVKIPFNNS